MTEWPDYYAILGLSRFARQDEIERRYQELAAQGLPDAEQAEIDAAYATLSDAQKRTQYDFETSIARIRGSSYFDDVKFPTLSELMAGASATATATDEPASAVIQEPPPAAELPPEPARPEPERIALPPETAPDRFPESTSPPQSRGFMPRSGPFEGLRETARPALPRRAETVARADRTAPPARRPAPSRPLVRVEPRTKKRRGKGSIWITVGVVALIIKLVSGLADSNGGSSYTIPTFPSSLSTLREFQATSTALFSAIRFASPTPVSTRAPTSAPPGAPASVYHYALQSYLQNGQAVLAGMDLRGESLPLAFLRGADLQNANLAGVNLSHANLHDANLRGAKLTNARLTDADLTGADLTGAILSNALFNQGTRLPDGSLWTSDTDLEQFTNPDHPDYWRPD